MLKSKKSHLLPYLLLLSGFFFLLEISFYIQCNHAYLVDYQLIASELNVPRTILPGIFYFLFSELFVHASFCLLTWGMAVLIAYLFQLPKNKIFYLGILLWFYNIVTVIVANQYFYPYSKFNELTRLILFNASLSQAVFWVLITGIGLWMVLAFLGLIRWIFAQSLSIYFFSGIILLSPIAFMQLSFLSANASPATDDRPNVIIVGVDSLRPDFLGFLDVISTRLSSIPS
jgi:hypothetical protein